MPRSGGYADISVFIDVGVVTRIQRYPVKSFSGEEVEQIRSGWHGLKAIVGLHSSKPAILQDIHG